MNKSALRNFAINARNELMKKVEAKALKIGITEESIKKAQFESSDAVYIDGKQLSVTEKKQRDRLIQRIREIGFKNVIEEVAYTWFNRFIALRFMEVNNYLPSKVRVLSSSEPGNPEPDIMKEALSVDLDIDKQIVYDFKVNNKSEELFKYMVIKQCNDLNKYLPFMFETIEDYKEILFPDNLLLSESFVRNLTNIEVIPEEDWEQIEIIGWLYQYYNTELNELVYDGSMSKSRVPKELLPAATQLFTPDWAVQYMVENSLGRLWLDGHPNDDLKRGWKYYLDKPSEQVTPGTEKNQHLTPEEIKVFDPCMGSGHILVYAFEVLMQIYQSCGYVPRDAAKLILEKNLYGLEIDDRANQLACFSLMMKARKYNRLIFNEVIELNLCSVVESNELKHCNIQFAKLELSDGDLATLQYLISEFHDAKEYGSILNVEQRDYNSIEKCLSYATNRGVRDLFELNSINRLQEITPKLTRQARIMSQTYDVVITNPPYLGNARMSSLLREYINAHYPDTKSDLSVVMYQKSLEGYAKAEGYISFITTTSWMFLKSFENFRQYLLEQFELQTLVDFGTELFDGKVGHNPIVSWITKKMIPQSGFLAIRLVEFCYSRREQKKGEYFNPNNRFYPKQSDFNVIPGSPIAYWASTTVISMFKENRTLGEISFPRLGMATADNNRFLRFWYEVEWSKVSLASDNRQKAVESNCRWFPYNKGGEFRKWYGNNEYVVDWENDGQRVMNFVDDKGKVRSHNYNLDFIFRPGITWSALSSGSFSSRYFPKGFLFDNAGSSLFTVDDEELYLIQGYLSTNLVNFLLPLINPTLNYQPGTIGALPFNDDLDPDTRKRIITIVKESIKISRDEWNCFEVSWEFVKHPLLQFRDSSSLFEAAFENWHKYTVEQQTKLKANEHALNRIFIECNGLQNELSPQVNDNDITMRTANVERDTKSFISYALGCLLGRYSLDQGGLVFAGGNFTPQRYKMVESDGDNILPVLSDAYFEDDILSRFVEFVMVTFGKETLTENLEFIANVVGKKDTETSREAIRRYFLNDFFKDHLQTYKKKPIYWLFTSGKQKAFNCLIYMHRYDKTTLSRIRTDYVHELQIRFDAEKKSLLNVIERDGTAREISAAKKELKTLDLKITELKQFEELLHHMADQQIEIDLDDGVDVNYSKFEGLLAKRS